MLASLKETIYTPTWHRHKKENKFIIRTGPEAGIELEIIILNGINKKFQKQTNWGNPKILEERLLNYEIITEQEYLNVSSI